MSEPQIPRRPDAECFAVNEKTLAKDVWPCPSCGGSSPRYPANHAKDCKARAAWAEMEDFAARALANVQSVDRSARPSSLHGWAGTVEKLASFIVKEARRQSRRTSTQGRAMTETSTQHGRT